MQKGLGSFGIIIAKPSAFFDFRNCLANRLAHFLSNYLRIVILVLPHDPSQVSSQAASFSDLEVFPALQGCSSFFDLTMNLIGSHILVFGYRFPSRGINRLNNDRS